MTNDTNKKWPFRYVKNVSLVPEVKELLELVMTDCTKDLNITNPLFRLSYISQLSLKNFFYHQKKKAEEQLKGGGHDRLYHSAGALFIGELWLEKLLGENADAKHSFNNSTESLKSDFQFALLLHDITHSFFSHLIEEVFAELSIGLDRTSRPVRYSKVETRLKLFSDAMNNNQSSKSNGPESKTYLSEEKIHTISNFIEGKSALPFINAIINSPLDADKIEYVFSDRELLGLPSTLPSPETWVEEFFEHQKINHAGFISLNGIASLRMLELLMERQHLYKNFYLAPFMRIPEKFVKTILIEIFTKFIPRLLGKHLSPSMSNVGIEIDFSFVKWQMLDEWLNDVMGEAREDLQDLGSDFLNEYTFLSLLYAILVDKKKKSYLSLPPLDKDTDDLIRLILEKLKDLWEPVKDSIPGSKAYKLMDNVLLSVPFYTIKNKYREVLEISRYVEQLYYPDVLIDVRKFPSFLATPPPARFTNNDNIVYETYLVPASQPSQWTRKHVGKFPLHRCNFEQFATDAIQILIIDPWEKPGSNFFVDIFRRLCNERNITLREKL